jgi:hypothetical protein
MTGLELKLEEVLEHYSREDLIVLLAQSLRQLEELQKKIDEVENVVR